MSIVSELRGARIFISGIVQGVGFRPFVYGLAKRLSLTGWVRNTSAGVDVEVDGPSEVLSTFVEALRHEAPPLAQIDELRAEDCPPHGFSTFEILKSEVLEEAFQPISPDVSLCVDCLREMFDPHDRRYRYPFINCTNCGPRYSIIRDIPYDRPLTTMASFPMCQACEVEYHDPSDRRFHAQPVACPECGPRIWLKVNGERIMDQEKALKAARELLKEGKVVAIKGLGGFHLACDATNAAAVIELRSRKLRVDKAFAVMMPDMASIEANCLIEPSEQKLLESIARPILILKRREGAQVVREVAPGQDTIGVMLPYTPLHVLLLEPEDGFPNALVMTSGNLSEEPIATENEDARERLSELADAFLMHDRDIQTRCDDSVVRVFGDEVYPLRRARGYTPFPVRLPWDTPPLLAAGAELKNAFCVTRGRYGILSHHIGDMENYETLQSFEEGVAHFERLFHIEPEALVYDLHPDYLATRYVIERAEREGLPAIGVQHHHAHVAACMAENGLDGEEPVVGVSFDGTGFGDDGRIWGGEFLVADYQDYERPFHLDYVPMPGGEIAIRQPWRMALAWLDKAQIDWSSDLPPVRDTGSEERRTVRSMLKAEINSPLTSSMGRLFDAVAALVGIRSEVNYEAQAAIELEATIMNGEEGAYPFGVKEGLIDAVPVIEVIVSDLLAGVETGRIAARFHNGLAMMIGDVCGSIKDQYGTTQVALSGGVWQNMVLLSITVQTLRDRGFSVLHHRKVPANDGGIALGQAAIAAQLLANGVIKASVYPGLTSKV